MADLTKAAFLKAHVSDTGEVVVDELTMFTDNGKAMAYLVENQGKVKMVNIRIVKGDKKGGPRKLAAKK